MLQEVVAAAKDPLLGCGRCWISWGIVIFGLIAATALRSNGPGDGFCIDTSLLLEILAPSAALENTQVFDATALRSTRPVNGFYIDPSLLLERFILVPSAHPREQGPETWTNILINTSRREATDQRDIVFAVLGLARKQVRDELVPDCTASVSSVYQKAMAIGLKTSRVGGDPDLLLYARFRGGIALPSWCIDFSSPNWFCRNVDNKMGEVKFHFACKGLQYSDIDLDVRRGSICLSGIGLGRVNTFMSLPPGNSNLTSLEELDREVISERGRLARRLVQTLAGAFSTTAAHLLERRFPVIQTHQIMAAGAVWETLHVGMASDITSDDEFGSNRASLHDGNDANIWALFEAYAAKHFRPAGHTKWAQYLPVLTSEREVERLLIRSTMTSNRSALFTTDDGYIGRARDPILKGDHVCIIYGSRYPVVLRPCGTSFKLITFAWVHGAMAGECVTPENRQRERKFEVV